MTKIDDFTNSAAALLSALDAAPTVADRLAYTKLHLVLIYARGQARIHPDATINLAADGTIEWVNK